MRYSGYPKYISVAERRAKAEKKLKQLKKKDPDITPVVITGRTLAQTWWGKEWNKNLERYADYANRIGRGRSYVRHSGVLDLKIKPGKIDALVQGSTSRPYSVTITIDKIPAESWENIKTECKGKMDNLEQLIAGKFPKAMEKLFTRRGNGLFPVPDEIKFQCSCPDSAYMCKHVAATLYGIGARLDEDPGLFFVLRKVDINDLVSESLKESRKELLFRAEKRSSRTISDGAGLSEMFGIDLDVDGQGSSESDSIPNMLEKGDDVPSDMAGKGDKTPVYTTENRSGTQVAVKNRKSSRGTSVKRRKTTPASSKTVKTGEKKKHSSTAKANISLKEIEQIIKRKKQGIAVSEVIKISRMEPQKVRNMIYRLKIMGKIENISRGVYIYRF